MSDHQNEVPSLLSDPQLPKKNNKTLNINSEIKFESIDLGNKNLVLFKRSDSGESIYFLANLSNETQEIKTDFEGNYKSLLIDSNYNLNKNNLQAWEFHVLK